MAECACCTDVLGSDVHLKDRCAQCITSEIQRVVDEQNVTPTQAAEVLERRRRFIDRREGVQPVLR